MFLVEKSKYLPYSLISSSQASPSTSSDVECQYCHQISVINVIFLLWQIFSSESSSLSLSSSLSSFSPGKYPDGLTAGTFSCGAADLQGVERVEKEGGHQATWVMMVSDAKMLMMMVMMVMCPWW